MAKNASAWYDKKWLMPTLAVLTFVFMPFREDIRSAVKDLGLVLDDRWFDSLLAVGLIGLAILLLLKSDRAARACEVLRQKVKQDLTNHRKKLNQDMATHGEQLKDNLSSSVDSQLQPVADRLGTLHSTVGAFGSRLEALDSRLAALDSRLAALDSRVASIDSSPAAIKDDEARSPDPA